MRLGVRQARAGGVAVMLCLTAAGLHAADAPEPTASLWRIVPAVSHGARSVSYYRDLKHGDVVVGHRIAGRALELGDDCVLFRHALRGGGMYFAACGDRIYKRKLKVKGAHAWAAPIRPAPPRL